MRSEETVCVVDDDTSARRGLERLLRAAGYRVAAFDSLGGLLESSRPEGSACLVLDATVAGSMEARVHEFCSGKSGRLPVIFVTASDDPKTREMAREIGAVGFFHKPVDGPALLDAIAWALVPGEREKRRGQEQRQE